MTAINFRTAFATMMVASGVDIKTTQALMGHSTPDMTLKVYAKKEESRLPEAMKKWRHFSPVESHFEARLDARLDVNRKVLLSILVWRDFEGKNSRLKLQRIN